MEKRNRYSAEFKREAVRMLEKADPHNSMVMQTRIRGLKG